MEQFVYSLRIGICPDFLPDEKFKNLVEFTRNASIDDVQFFLNMEEVNQGHLSLEETSVWLEMIQGFKEQLEKLGIGVSLNPWTTTLHTDRGRKLSQEQKFTTMTDKNGRQAKAVCCPLDEAFQDYIRQIYSEYAKLNFEVIWIEDDFRLHNHAPLEWGGCFCKKHMKEFSRRMGHSLSREELVQGILQSGEPHPYRKLWLEIARDTILDFAALLGEAIHKEAPATRIGLMSSAPEVHCAEGRKWKGILSRLAGDTRPLNRPHLPAYSENTSRRYCLDFQKHTRLSAYMTLGIAELWPELDNFPHTTFSKSHQFMEMQIESVLGICAEGITINIFDMIGNGISPMQKNEEILEKRKPYLCAVKDLKMKLEEEQGVCVMYSSESAYTLHTKNGNRFSEIQPNETFWAEYLSAFGIANRYCCNTQIKGEIAAIGGQYLRNLTREQIENIFCNNFILLNGDAAEVLEEMGLGHLANIGGSEWLMVNSGIQAYEQVVNDFCFQGLSKARMSAQVMCEETESGDYLSIHYSGEREVQSELRTPSGDYAGDGVTIVHSNVLIFPFGHLEKEYTQLLNPIRQEMLQKMLLSQGKGAIPTMVKNCQYVTVNHFVKEDKQILLLTNFSMDDFHEVELNGVFDRGKEELYLISRENGQRTLLPCQSTEDGVVLSGKLPHMSTICILVETKSL